MRRLVSTIGRAGLFLAMGAWGATRLGAQDKGVLMVELPVPADVARIIEQTRAAGEGTTEMVWVELHVGSEEDLLVPHSPGDLRRSGRQALSTFGPFSVQHRHRQPFTKPHQEFVLVVRTRIQASRATTGKRHFAAQLRLGRDEYEEFKKTVETQGALLYATSTQLNADQVMDLKYKPLGISPEAFAKFTSEPKETKGAGSQVETKKSH